MGTVEIETRPKEGGDYDEVTAASKWYFRVL